MKRGDLVEYRCRAGRSWYATVLAVHSDALVDLAVDVGTSRTVDLTRIPVVASSALLRPGTCCATGSRDDDEEAEADQAEIRVGN